MQCYENYVGVKNPILCLTLTFIEIPHKNYGCPKGLFLRVWVSKWHPEALLARVLASTCPLSTQDVTVSVIWFDSTCQFCFRRKKKKKKKEKELKKMLEQQGQGSSSGSHDDMESQLPQRKKEHSWKSRLTKAELAHLKIKEKRVSSLIVKSLLSFICMLLHIIKKYNPKIILSSHVVPYIVCAGAFYKILQKRGSNYRDSSSQEPKWP